MPSSARADRVTPARGAAPGRDAARPVEIAEAAALATLVAAVGVVDRVVPLGFAAFLLQAFPAAVLGARHRPRAGAGLVVTATLLAFLGAGPGMAGKAFAAAATGVVVGLGTRREWSTPRIASVATLVSTLPGALLVTALLAVLADLRSLVLAQILDGTRGLARILGAVPGLPDALVATGTLVVEHWWVMLPAITLVAGFGAAALTAVVVAGPLEHVLDHLPPVARDLGALHGPAPDAGRAPDAVAPLPLRLREVGVHRDGRRVLAGVDLDLVVGALVTVTGTNGAGKSTLGRVLGGQAHDEGRVDRPGLAGLGAPGGTAMVFQRPESQVLGVRAGDDVAWGAPPDVDVHALLTRVGLDGAADRETDTLSGGELQRLALAAALARRPAVIVSDETTAMLDPAGRRAVCALLTEVAAAGTAVVHITHRPAEIADATHRLVLAAPDPAPPSVPEPGTRPASARRRGGALLLRGVGVDHDAGTPWHREVLDGVDLAVPAGHTVLVTGSNGAGKSTLAWVLAGLVAPSRGEITLDGAPLGNGRDGALLGVQHTRSALLRSTVAEDLRDVSGADPGDLDAALTLVGLDPARFRHRGTDALSGGEARRVVLAGLLAAGAPVLVLDEPLAGLDDTARTAVVAALAAVRATGTTLVIATHDIDPLAPLADATVHVADGTTHAPATLTPESRSPRPQPAGSAARRGRVRRGRVRRGRAPGGGPGPRPPGRRRARRVGRTLPHPSWAGRLHPGTKLGVLVALVVALGVAPAWTTVAVAVLMLLVWSWAARMTPAAWPRLPWPVLVVLGVVLVVVALGAPPTTTVAGIPVSLAAVERSARLMAVGLVTLAGSVLFVASTPVGTLPALLRRVASALAWTRLPTGEWALTAALGLRMAPTLVAEVRTVHAMLGQRRRARRTTSTTHTLRDRFRATDGAVVGALTLVCALAIRRAADTADALAARGGTAGPPAPACGRIGRSDALTIAFSLSALVLAVLFAHPGPLG